MPRRRWHGRARVAPLTPTLRAYLKGGFDAMLAEAADLEVYQLAGQVMNGHVDKLRELWRAHAAEIKAAHPALTFAEYRLRESGTATVPVQGEVRRRR